MNFNVHCAAVFDGQAYAAKWFLGDMVLFSAEVAATFSLDHNTEKRAFELFLLRHGTDKICDTGICFADQRCPVTVFCPLEQFEELFDKFLVILNELGQPASYFESFAKQLEERRQRLGWKQQWDQMKKNVLERRRKDLIEKLDECTAILYHDPEASAHVKRRRTDLIEVLDLLQQRANPASAKPTEARYAIPIVERAAKQGKVKIQIEEE